MVGEHGRVVGLLVTSVVLDQKLRKRSVGL